MKQDLKELIMNTEAYSKKSTCVSRNVGACIFDLHSEEVIAYGTNRMPDKLYSCKDANECHRRKLSYKSGEGLEYCKCIHAEVDAILQAANEGKRCNGAYIYINTPPCPDCVMHIYQAGIKGIIFGGDYPKKVRQAGEKMAKTLDLLYISLGDLLSEKVYDELMKSISEEGEKDV